MKDIVGKLVRPEEEDLHVCRSLAGTYKPLNGYGQVFSVDIVHKYSRRKGILEAEVQEKCQNVSTLFKVLIAEVGCFPLWQWSRNAKLK